MAIYFHNPPKEDFPSRTILKTAIKNAAKNHCAKLGDLNYIFVTDEELLDMNKEYLSHDYYTDIITFDLSSGDGKTEGDVFISIDRVKENATKLNESTENEYVRVIAHGILHLMGYKDKEEIEIKRMRAAEKEFIDAYVLLAAQTPISKK